MKLKDYCERRMEYKVQCKQSAVGRTWSDSSASLARPLDPIQGGKMVIRIRWLAATGQFDFPLRGSWRGPLVSYGRK